jgi:Ca-activated chloride channel family protein
MYLNLSRGSELRERVQVILNKLDRTRTAAQRESRQPIERYPWALIPGMVSLVVAFALRLGRRLRAPAPAWVRAGAGAAAVSVFASATAWGGVIVPGGEPGPSPYQLYDRADYSGAAEGFERRIEATRSPAREAALEFGRGAAAFRQAEHDVAIEAFGRALTSPDRGVQAEAAYNLGNALAQKARTLPKAKGRVSAMIELITEAIGHYDEALRIQPGHADARENRERLAKFLEQLKEFRQQLREKARQRRQNGQGRSQQERDGQQGQDQQGQQGENQPGGQGQGSQGGESGEEEEEEEEEAGEEQDGNGSSGSQGEEGRGREGESDGQGGGKQDDQQTPAPEGQEKERSGEEKAEGEVEAKGGGSGGDGEQEKRRAAERTGASADAQRNRTTGFSRSEARALLRALSDEDYVRPLTERAPPESSYKNW